MEENPEPEPRYIIVKGLNIYGLCAQVNEKMAHGYQPAGGVVLNKPEYNEPVYLQAMTLANPIAP